MLFADKIEILVVDDEPDVLAVTKLALRHTRVFGVPIQVHTATSKAAAVELLAGKLSTGIPGYHTAQVAFIDVVMESDHAGLDLCQHIRDDLGNQVMQIYLRTGQPGVAPEREVIDRFDINGYLAKAEVTESKLYTLVKAGAREFNYLTLSGIFGILLEALIPAARSRQQLAGTLDGWVATLNGPASGERPETLYDIRMAFFDGDDQIAGTWSDQAGGGRARRDQLLGQPARALGPGGDTLHVDGVESLLRVAASPTTAPLDVMTRGSAPPPAFAVPLWHNFARNLAALWRMGE